MSAYVLKPVDFRPASSRPYTDDTPAPTLQLSPWKAQATTELKAPQAAVDHMGLQTTGDKLKGVGICMHRLIC